MPNPWDTPETRGYWGAPYVNPTTGSNCPTGMVCAGDIYTKTATTCVSEKALRCVGPGLNWHLLALGFIFSAFDSFGIGSNDVANAFATSVGSGSLSLKQAMGIAFFTEIIGAIFLGAAVTDTIKGSIVNLSAFKGQPDVLMVAMAVAMISSSIWVNLSSYWGFPVSTTHSIVGAMIGVGFGFRGNDSTLWPKDPFITVNPPGANAILKFESLGGILLSFALSPILAGILGAILFAIIKYGIMLRKKNDNAYFFAKWTSPIFVFGTWLLIAFFMVYKGAPGLKLDQVPIETTIGVAFAVGGGAGLIVLILGLPILERQINAKPLALFGNETLCGLRFEALAEYFKIPLRTDPISSDEIPYMEWLKKIEAEEAAQMKADALESEANDGEKAAALIETKPSKLQVFWNTVAEYALCGVNKEVRMHDTEHQPWHHLADKYDERAERVYGYLQVMTASFASLSHGGNDVSNAVAPFCVIIEIFNSGFNNLANKSSSKVPVPVWVLAYGGAWISIGLFCYGYVIMRSLGNNLTYHSPSRGFCMELGALTTVLAATKLGLPVSTTHCITGATVGVGLLNGNPRAVNWKMFAIACLGWCITLPLTAIGSAVMLMFVIYSPHKLEQAIPGTTVMQPTIVQCYEKSCMRITQEPTN